jgi:DoxX-like family
VDVTAMAEAVPPTARRKSPKKAPAQTAGKAAEPAALAALKGAGAAGLLLGLLGLRPLGIAAAIGLVLFFTGALATHVRARAFRNIAFPGAYLALAIASAALAVAAH